MMDYLIPQTIKVLGHINDSLVLILVDSGSTHNFIQDCTTKFFGPSSFPESKLSCPGRNGDELPCSSVSKHVALQLSFHTLFVYLFTLPLSGVEIILGVKWLTALGPMLNDCEQLTMKFI